MFRFFRNIRFTLLKEEKTGKYLKYALSEIFLVMIGILLALQVNNWNDRRKDRENLNKIYKIVKSDLEMDCKAIEGVFDEMGPIKSNFIKVIEGEMTIQDYEECDRCHRLITGYPDIALRTRGINLLKNIGYTSIETEDSLFQELSEFYQEYLTEINVDHQSVNTSFNESLTHWINSYDWYSDLAMGRQNSAQLEYMLNNPDYKNRVADFYWVFYEIYLPHLEEYQEKARFFINKIESRTRPE